MPAGVYPRPPLDVRFWAKVAKDGPSGCWLWTAALDRKGYGAFNVNGRLQRAHRVAYRLLVGRIPEGLVLDHLCRVRACVNPAHLEPVTRQTILLRGKTVVARQARQTHCKRGHPFDAANTYRWTNGKRTMRMCRTCHRERELARYRASR